MGRFIALTDLKSGTPLFIDPRLVAIVAADEDGDTLIGLDIAGNGPVYVRETPETVVAAVELAAKAAHEFEWSV